MTMKIRNIMIAAALALVLTLPAGFALGESARFTALKIGDSGEAVARLQRDLRALSLLDFSGEPLYTYPSARI